MRDNTETPLEEFPHAFDYSSSFVKGERGVRYVNTAFCVSDLDRASIEMLRGRVVCVPFWSARRCSVHRQNIPAVDSELRHGDSPTRLREVRQNVPLED
jgi:hypothetical protein